MTPERTYVMVKPDGVQRGLVGEIIKRFEQRGFQLLALKIMRPSPQLLQEHYVDLKSKAFFEISNCPYVFRTCSMHGILGQKRGEHRS